LAGRISVAAPCPALPPSSFLSPLSGSSAVAASGPPLGSAPVCPPPLPRRPRPRLARATRGGGLELSRARRPGRQSSSSRARADGDGGAPAAYLATSLSPSSSATASLPLSIRPGRFRPARVGGGSAGGRWTLPQRGRGGVRGPRTKQPRPLCSCFSTSLGIESRSLFCNLE